MSQNSTIADAAASDFEALSDKLAALRTDMASLAETVSGNARNRGSRMATDIAEGFGDAKDYVERTGKFAEHQLEKSVADHPLLALGLAAGAGLLVGVMSRR
jgi:ElaB/YqjD/DUF883 family membrane-anchored ribosome-binding protein